MNNGFEAITEVFGSNVFNDSVMRARLPKNIYKAFKHTINEQLPLDESIADVIANAMKDWAIEKGATHYCHWFQPMTGRTAEKHDSFISPTSDGKIIMEFSGRELCQSEPDASSFPSGGLRATFEARGYTAWDITSPAFIKENGKNISLYIPSAFCSYTGQTLDKKTPMLRSMDALNKQALRILRVLGNKNSKRVTATLGAEQEYFLIDRGFFEKRPDLLLTGKTLIGALSPRGQEMDDHYFSVLHERIASFMHEANVELWKLGVAAKTHHNEVSPAQYELAPVFSTVNVGTDHNQLTMEILQKVALRHNLVCLLHEKPFAGVNGSGKHINWSMTTDDGINLLNPGKTPHDNMVFLIILTAIIRAVDKYAKLLRATIANTGNEHRLGANEAPPAIVSMFLGDQLTDIISQIAGGGAKSSIPGGQLKLGVSTLPPLPKDSTDRNRTSPFAFTGNRFEFRMPGSSQSPSGPAFVLNTIVAETLSEIADELEKSKNIKTSAQEILKRIVTEHRNIIFNGDNYTEDWVVEAKRRGLPNIRSTVESLKTIMDKENVNVLSKHKVLTKAELHARTEILLEAYSTSIKIEAKTMVNMIKRQIIPAGIKYSRDMADTVGSIAAAGVDVGAQKAMLEKICDLTANLDEKVKKLEKSLEKAGKMGDTTKQAELYCENVIVAMNSLREVADELEMNMDASLWPLPTYAEMLFLK